MKINKMSEELFVKNFMAGYVSPQFEPMLREKLEIFLGFFSAGLDELISELLTEMRSAVSAEAASIYVVDKDILRFVYVQNDSMNDGGGDEGGKGYYINKTVPIGDESICGYVAKTKKPLLVGDVRNPPDDLPFKFNDEFDNATGYRTISVLTAPIIDDGGELAGILQLINHKDENFHVAPFEDWMLGYVLLLTDNFFPMIARSFDRYRDISMSRPDKEDSSYGSVPMLVMFNAIRRRFYGLNLKFNKNLPWLANSGISWTKRDRGKEFNISKRLLSYADYINKFEDLSTVIDIMLTEAKDATNADAGTFYLVQGGDLCFAYVQNDTLFVDDSQRYKYVNSKIPVNNESISGYVALERKSLNIPNVSHLPDGAPYSFNRSFDDASGYHTVSALTFPILGSGGTVLAVIQLINSKDAFGMIKEFDEADVRYANLLAGQTMPFLTRSIMTRRLIEAMLRMSEMRDPKETGMHVRRVGTLAAEIYHRWAQNHMIDEDTLRVEKDAIGLAAMLHDIGKVAVPDSILGKEDKLTPEEYDVMKTHCARGASMYASADSRLERMAYQITLHHHERWDGSGYTGDPGIPPLSGENIPLPARITSAADVLDALVFPRKYKKAWKFEDAMRELEKNAGSQFDPDVIKATLEISNTLKTIIEEFR